MNKFELKLCVIAVLLLNTVQAVTGQIRITHGPYLQNVSETEATIVWLTDKNAVSWVELAPNNNLPFYNAERPRFFASKIGIKTEAKIHVVTIRHLEPGTKYRYRVYSQEVLKHDGWHVYYGDIAATDVFSKSPLTFVTNNHSKPETTFTVVNDIHGKNDVLEQLIIKAEPKKNDMIIFNGDMATIINSEEDIFAGFMDKSIELFAKETPLYYARGNHETRGSFAAVFKDYFPQGQQGLYFMFRQGPVCFIVLDSGEDKPDSDLEYSGIVDYDTYRDDEALWLREAVKSRDFIEAPFKVAVCHMPPANDWHGEKEVLQKFVPILNEAKIDVMLCGHLHRHIKRPPTELIKFPVIVNSNTNLLRAKATITELSIEVIATDGSKVDSFVLKK
ncbi:MAG: metallophosphoesterase [Bacteroidales bacterium]|jgi:Icc-related predicted phosphoesterase|nr:metallophosphoesterase [Bacteroidales bacterium]